MNLIEAAKIVLTETTLKPRDIVKIFQNTTDWGDLGERVRTVGSYLEVVDSFYYAQAQATDKLIKDWTTPNGYMAKYFKSEYGITFALVDSFFQLKAEGRYKKITDDGIVGIVLRIK